MKNYYAQIKLIPFALLVLLMFALIQKCNAQEDSVSIKLDHYKQLFINGIITSQEYETLRKQTLGIPAAPVEKQIIEIKQAQSEAPQVETFGLSADSLYRKGKQDALKNFDPSGVSAGTVCTTMFAGPLIGLIPAIVCSSTPPAENRMICPNSDYLKNPDYLRGYTTEARSEKKRAAWISWGIGTGIDIIAGIITGVAVSRSKSNH